MSREVRNRALLGIGIPLLAFVFLAALILAFSRILLAVPEELAPWVALAFAATILAGCTLAATIRGTRGFAFLVTVLVLTIIGGGVAGAVLGERPVHSLVEEEAAHPEGPPPPGAAPPPEETPAEEESPPPTEPAPPGGGGQGGAGEPIPLVAQGTAFDTSQLSLPAGGEVVIAFDNRDPLPHNLAIYPEQGGDPIFQGEIITGPAQVEYRFPSPEPGTYDFRCDIHPQMTGSVTVG
jgi:plastocyanin